MYAPDILDILDVPAGNIQQATFNIEMAESSSSSSPETSVSITQDTSQLQVHDHLMAHDTTTDLTGIFDGAAITADATTDTLAPKELPTLGHGVTAEAGDSPLIMRPHKGYSSLRIFLLVVSSLAAAATLSCVLGMFILAHLVKISLGLVIATWPVLPQFERQHLLDDIDTSDKEEKAVNSTSISDFAGRNCSTDDSDDTLSSEKDIAIGSLYSACSIKPRPHDVYEAGRGVEEGHNSSRLPDTAVTVSNIAPDPEELPLPTTPTLFPGSLARPVQEVASTIAAPTLRPLWSVRASDAPALGITSSAPMTPLPLPLRRRDPTLDIPGAFAFDEDKQVISTKPATNRAYSVPLPQLDIAFAMQLRPGLGLGSDSAWLVRFLMTMFGWMTVLWGSSDVQPRHRRAALLD